MFSRSNVIAFALATIGAIALAPAGASAFPGHGFAPIAHAPVNAAPHVPFKSGPIGGNPNTWSPKKAPIGGNPISWTPKKPNGGCTGPFGCNPNTWTPQAHWHHHPHELPYFVAPVVTTEIVAPPVQVPVQTVVSTPVRRTADICNCLTKDYLPDGSVMFKDLCTQEAAVASPNDMRAQMQGDATQVR
jgi:hypothetical protein